MFWADCSWLVAIACWLAGGFIKSGLVITLLPRTNSVAVSVCCSWLIAIAYWLAGGFIKSGLGNRIAYSMVAAFGKTTLGLTYSLVGTAGNAMHTLNVLLARVNLQQLLDTGLCFMPELLSK